MNIINTKGSSDNFLNSVPLKIKGQNTIITKETVVDGQSQTTILDGQTAYNEIKNTLDEHSTNFSNIYTKAQTRTYVDNAIAGIPRTFTANKAIAADETGRLIASLASRQDLYSIREISDIVGEYGDSLKNYLNALNTKSNQVATLTRSGVVKIADNLGNVSDFDSSDPVALSAARGKWLYENKAPIPHNSSDTTYGIGTSTQYGHVKIIDRDDRTDFVAGEALSAHVGAQLRTSIVNDRDYRTKFLGGLYNAYFSQSSCGILTVKQNESTQQNIVFGIDTWSRSTDSVAFGPAHTGKLVPIFPSEIPHSEADRGNYGVVPCWTQLDSSLTYFATPENPIDPSSDSVQGNSSIILKHKGSYLLIYKLIARPNRELNLTEDYTVNDNMITFNYEKMYTYLSQQLTMRFQIDTDVYDSTYYSTGSTGTFTSWAPPNYQSALIANNGNRRTYVQGFGAEDEGISFQIIHTLEDNVRILTRIFSNNRFNSNKQHQLLTVGLNIVHLHTAASDWNEI